MYFLRSTSNSKRGIFSKEFFFTKYHFFFTKHVSGTKSSLVLKYKQ